MTQVYLFLLSEWSCLLFIEMLNVINLLDDTRKKWATCVAEKCCLQEDNESLRRENKYGSVEFYFLNLFFRNLQTELHATIGKLHESHSQIAALMTAKKALELEIKEYKKRYEQIKETLRVMIWFCLNSCAFFFVLLCNDLRVVISTMF